jgi:hypothetical protein
MDVWVEESDGGELWLGVDDVLTVGL